MVSKKIDPGYARAISAIKQREGIERGAHSWLAKRLGIPRQNLFYLSKVGFPDDLAPKVARLTGMSVADLLCRDVSITAPRPVWDTICTESPTASKLSTTKPRRK